MTRRSLEIITALFVLALVTPAWAQETSSSVRFTLVDETGIPSGVSVSVIDAPGEIAHELQPTDLTGGKRGWTHATAEAKTWISEPSFIISFPPREPRQPGSELLATKLPAMEIALSFRLTAIYGPRDYQFDVKAIANVSKTDFATIRDMPARLRFEQLILLGQFATNLVKKNPNDAVTKERVRFWFDTLWSAFGYETPLDDQLPLRFDGDIESVVRAAFSDDPNILNSRYLAHIREYDTTFWREAGGNLTRLLNGRRCDMALLLVDYVKDQNAKFPDAAAAQGISDVDQQFAAMQRKLDNNCNGPLPKDVALPPPD